MTSSRRLPAAKTPAGSPHFAGRLHSDVTIEGLRSAFETAERCPILKFLRKVVGAYDIYTTRWTPCPEMADTIVRKSCYTVPMGDDIPAAVKRIVNFPDTISATSVWRLRTGPNELTLLQQSYTKDIMYSDRFKAQNTLVFQADPDGGIKVQQWLDTIWEKPLPWTHTVIKRLIEREAKESATRVLDDLLQILEDAARQR
jgi:hypothetical protein